MGLGELLGQWAIYIPEGWCTPTPWGHLEPFWSLPYVSLYVVVHLYFLSYLNLGLPDGFLWLHLSYSFLARTLHRWNVLARLSYLVALDIHLSLLGDVNFDHPVKVLFVWFLHCSVRYVSPLQLIIKNMQISCSLSQFSYRFNILWYFFVWSSLY